MEIKQMLVPVGVACRPANPMYPLYITIHETANTNKNAGALSHGKYLQGAGKDYTVSWHYAVDDTLIVQSIPDNENAWHAGDGIKGTGNRTSLAIEICINPESDFKKACENAAALCKELMNKYNIPIENVVQHNYWNGKDCPFNIRRGRPITWASFINSIKRSDKLYYVQAGAFKNLENAVAYQKELEKMGIKTIIKEL